MKRLEERRTIHSINPKEEDGKETVYLPVDMIIEILTKLPARSVSKLICLSKLWSSIIQGKHFTDLYLTRSSTRHLLLSGDDKFYSCQENPSSSNHRTTRKTISGIPISAPVRGLICCLDVYTHAVTVGNPSTGQMFTLPPITNDSSLLFWINSS
ncbi:unnamed protein product [Microthlaspi erraticum]|uniref:F-box domain-containing protein n=1 Tax=Microthlaspi erraticum TaxID=1685480 RepID=A0A6D2KH35_9BRAS|nr:unnamed protein product [Microthlaspi erraticum]